MAVTPYLRAPRVGTASDGLAQRLRGLWQTKPGLYGWIWTVDHKEIGIRYIVTAFAFLIVGGIEALIMRLQLAQPNQALLTPEQYDQLFSMHGITMIFLYALPVLSGFSPICSPCCSARATWRSRERTPSLTGSTWPLGSFSIRASWSGQRRTPTHCDRSNQGRTWTSTPWE